MTLKKRMAWLRPVSCQILATLGLLMALSAAMATAGELPTNIARAKKYTLAPPPNYAHCTDPGDTTQLTDGQLTDGYFWTQKGTVGWNRAPYAQITVDLGQVEPIGGISFRTAAGTAGVSWPTAIRILVSDNGQRYHDVGDLVVLDHQDRGPWPQGYAVRRLVTSALGTRGRYVMLLVLSSPGANFIFVDEVEIFRGPEELLQGPPGGQFVGDGKGHLTLLRVAGCFRRRYEADVAHVAQAVDDAELQDESARNRLLARLAAVGKKLHASKLPSDPSFRTIVPFNKAHGELYAVQAALWNALGHPGLTAWVPPAWDPLNPHTIPPAATSGKIEVHSMLGEYRAAALNLANSTDRTQNVQLAFDGLPGAPTPDYITVAEVPWTDTSPGKLVAAALPEAQQQDGQWSITVPPGLVRQVWFTVRATDLPAGRHTGTVVITSARFAPLRVPVTLHVYPLTFPKRTALWLGGWSYTNGQGSYGVGPENRAAFLKHLQRRLVNAPWATSSVMMNFKFTANGSIRLDTRIFDDWVGQWPNARAYLVFLNQGHFRADTKPAFAGATSASPEFNRRVGAWISAWVRHLRGKGIAPGQLCLLIHDEPHEGTKVEGILAWAKAIHAAQPEVRIWCDPTYRDPMKAPPELFATADILCPNRPMWLHRGVSFTEFYVAQQRSGRTLQFYSCSGPARLLDPYSYYRLQAWHCWQLGATGSFFWAFGDNGYSSSWNEYLARHGPYTPLFLDHHCVVAGKQMEAIREGAEDYENFVMLRAAVREAKSTGLANASMGEAEQLLRSAPGEILSAPGASSLNWHDAKDRTKVDAVRVRMLEVLTSLQ